MDGDAMYPEGFHPIRISHTPDRLRTADYTSRTVAGVKYYFVDFGISCYLPDTSSPRLVTGSNGRDRDPPELSDTVPYDPFKLDIFIIGNMLRQEFCQVGVFRWSLLTSRLKVEQEYSNLEFFRPLIQEMAARDPANRPNAVEALALWKKIRDTVWTMKREWRPRPRLEHPVETVVLDSISLRQLFTFVTTSLVNRFRA